MVLTSPKKAKKFFEAKMNFTTCPAELNQMIKDNEDISIIDVRTPQDFAQGRELLNAVKELLDEKQRMLVG